MSKATETTEWQRPLELSPAPAKQTDNAGNPPSVMWGLITVVNQTGSSCT